MIRYTVLFAGRVQGVGFRYTARNIGRHFPVAGYVQNLSDGSVRLVVEGDDMEVAAFFAEVKDVMGRYIYDMKIDRSPATGEFGAAEPGAIKIKYDE